MGNCKSVMGHCKSVVGFFRSAMQPSVRKRALTPDTDPKPNCLQNKSRVYWHYTLELIQKQFQSVGVSVKFRLISSK